MAANNTNTSTDGGACGHTLLAYYDVRPELSAPTHGHDTQPESCMEGAAVHHRQQTRAFRNVAVTIPSKHSRAKVRERKGRTGGEGEAAL